MRENLPLVSIIITTKNEESAIEALLVSIKKQTYKQIEIIIVDNNSTDKTLAIAKRFTSHIYTKGPERSAQRNYGAKKSRGSIYLFLDADMVLSPRVVEKCVDTLDKKTMVGVVIPEQSVGEGYWSQCKILERKFYLGIDWIESARCFRKEVFYKVGEYDETMSGPEDFDLPQKVKSTYGKNSVARISEYIIHDEGKLVFSELIKRKYYYGRSMRQYFTKSSNQGSAIQQGNILQRYYLFLKNPQLLLKDPLVSLGMILLKTSEFAALGVGTLMGRK